MIGKKSIELVGIQDFEWCVRVRALGGDYWGDGWGGYWGGYWGG